MASITNLTIGGATNAFGGGASGLNVAACQAICKATADVDALAEVFIITPTKGDGKGVLIVQLWATGNTAVAGVTASIPAGVSAGKQAISTTFIKQTNATTPFIGALQIDTAKVLQTDGTFTVTLTPGASDKLLTDHAAYVAWVELI